MPGLFQIIRGLLFPLPYTVATLPAASKYIGGLVRCSDHVWSGGVGGLLESDGTVWRDPDGNIAATTLGRRTFSNGLTWQFVIPPTNMSAFQFVTREQDYLTNAHKLHTVTGTAITSPENAFDLSISAATVAANAVGVIEVTLAAGENFFRTCILGFGGGGTPLSIKLEAEQGGTYVEIFNDLAPVMTQGIYYAPSIGNLATNVVNTKFRLTLTARAAAATTLRYWLMHQGDVQPHTKYLHALDGSNAMLGNVDIKKGSIAQVGSTDNFDVQLKRNNAVIATLTATGLDATKLFYAGQDTDVRYALASSLTETVQDIIGPFVADSSDLDFTYDDAGNALAAVIKANAVDLNQLAQIATARFLGRATAGTGDPEALTTAQATALLDVFTTLLKGLVPAPGAATGRFLKDDGTWAAAPGAGTGLTHSEAMARTSLRF